MILEGSVLRAVAGVAILAWAVPSAIAQTEAEGNSAPEADQVVEEAGEDAPQGLLPVPDYSGELGEREYLLGDWLGSRQRLADEGFTARFDVTQHLQSVTSGGIDTGTEYGAAADLLLQLDLYRMGVMPGALLTIRGESRLGGSVNPDVGLLFPTNLDLGFPLTDPVDDELPFAITELTYTQFLSEKFAVTAGKINTLGGDSTEFAGGRGQTQFMNAQLVFNPVMGFSVPYSTLGVGFYALPTDGVTLSGALVNSTDSSTNSGFGDFGEGWTFLFESNFRH
ncbi:MAG: carbohydrate porin, partial [Planctomycetota bacterium]